MSALYTDELLEDQYDILLRVLKVEKEYGLQMQKSFALNTNRAYFTEHSTQNVKTFHLSCPRWTSLTKYSQGAVKEIEMSAIYKDELLELQIWRVVTTFSRLKKNWKGILN